MANHCDCFWKPVCAAEGHIPSLAFLNTTKNVVHESLLLSTSVFRYTAEFTLPPLSLTTSVFQVLKGFLPLKMAPVSLVEIFMNRYLKKKKNSKVTPFPPRKEP